jgi:hypothetical protein
MVIFILSYITTQEIKEETWKDCFVPRNDEKLLIRSGPDKVGIQKIMQEYFLKEADAVRKPIIRLMSTISKRFNRPATGQSMVTHREAWLDRRRSILAVLELSLVTFFPSRERK